MYENKLSVCLFGKPVGMLVYNKGKMRFTYLDNATQAISLSMPLGEKSFDHLHCHAFFAGLLPEGHTALQTLGAIFGIDANNVFELLQIVGYDCAGAVSFHIVEESVTSYETSAIKGEILTDSQLEKKIRSLPADPFFVGIEGFRACLTGVQDKVAVCVIQDQIAIPEKGSFTTHILKPGIAPYQERILNEYFSMRLAKRIGLNVCDVLLRTTGKTEYLLIPRYDREIQGNSIKHYHQEDFCQALGLMPYQKFQKDSKRGFKSCFNLLQKTNVPAISRNQFMQMIIFNYLLGNTNAHCKNYALIYLSPKYLQLAPFYDITCTFVEKHSSQMAMKVAGIYDWHDISINHWRQFCHYRGYSFPAFKCMMQQQIDTIIQAAKSERVLMRENGHSIDIVDQILNHLQKQCAHAHKVISS
jgi:serine/threonine-protein kinase HipA